MKVQNMTGSTGREVPNQFIITDDNGNVYFQSYRTVIARRVRDVTLTESEFDKVTLDHNWNYSKTTGRYRNQFLNETRKETEAKIKDGTYTVTNLN